MKRITRRSFLFFALVLCVMGTRATDGEIRSTRHNLSISGPGDITSTSEERICIFCHIPHRENAETIYLWNRSENETVYTPYFSSTLEADVGQPTGSSRMCLSCHDGTIALGAVASRTAEIPFEGGIRFMPEQSPAHLGTDLSDDHPVSFAYDAALAAANPEIRDPSGLPGQIRLEDDSQMQCTSCHDPHDDPYGHFLVMDNTASALCTECHDETGWLASAHANSNAVLDRTGGLWPNTDYATVAENACESCHIPHSAGIQERLLYFTFEEDNCLACHDGGVAGTDIAEVISRPYNHPVQNFTGVHDAAEDFTTGSVAAHVECSDCHDPHQANSDPSPGGSMVSGATRGASGVSAGGAALSEANNVYEICFKCHADNNVISELPVARQIGQLNTRLEFDPANPAYHPVEASGRNPDVPSLLPPYTVSSTIQCTDCHGSSDAVGARGPHGSDWQYLLTERYVTVDGTPESASSYALCYQCHSRTGLLNDVSFPHSTHVVDQSAPCSACHDPHGISYMQGSASQNSHLINFDLNIVLPNGAGMLEFNDQGRFQGECFLNCHGQEHAPESYSF